LLMGSKKEIQNAIEYLESVTPENLITAGS
jgi:hypothetical protein